VAPLAVGAACDGTVPCAALLRCKNTDDAGALDAGDAGKRVGVCEAESTAVGAGCSAGDEVCSRAAGLYCRRPGKQCAVIAVEGASAACGDLDGGTVAACATGKCTIADGEKAGTCTAAIADDAACDPTGNGPGCLPPAKCVGAPGAATCKKLDPSLCK
jgi:hypothetical protein